MRKMLTKAQTFIHEELEVAQFLRRVIIFNISKAFQHVAFFRRNFKEPALHDSKPTPAQNEVFSGFLVFFEVAFSLFICCFDAQILWKGKNAWCERGISFGITFRVDYIANHVIRRLIFKVAELNGWSRGKQLVFSRTSRIIIKETNRMNIALRCFDRKNWCLICDCTVRSQFCSRLFSYVTLPLSHIHRGDLYTLQVL